MNPERRVRNRRIALWTLLLMMLVGAIGAVAMLTTTGYRRDVDRVQPEAAPFLRTIAIDLAIFLALAGVVAVLWSWFNRPKNS
jgi:hypothetical protein